MGVDMPDTILIKGKGSDFIEIERITDDMMYVRVKYLNQIRLDSVIPNDVFISLLENTLTKYAGSLLLFIKSQNWSEEYTERILNKITNYKEG
jgi:hypothetical protein